MSEEEDIQRFGGESVAKFDFIPLSAALISQVRKIQSVDVSARSGIDPVGLG